MKVLNLYAGAGGNRKLWEDVEVTAVEIVPKIADIYQGFFPEDKMVISDAHQYLLDHFKEYDFIWSSPPCPTHSMTNNFLHHQGIIRYPDMRLYEEIIFLSKWFKGKYCVENVRSYYDPLIKPQILDRHYFWANFFITPFPVHRDFNISNSPNERGAHLRLNNANYLEALQKFHGFEIDNIELLRNCVYPPLGLHILKDAINKTQRTLTPDVIIEKQTKRTGE